MSREKNTTARDDMGKLICLAWEYSYCAHTLLKKVPNNQEWHIEFRSSLFLLRHSIELFLKGIHLLDSNFEHNHNLQELFNSNSFKKLKNTQIPDFVRGIADNKNIDENLFYKSIVEEWSVKLEALSQEYVKHAYLENFNTIDPTNIFLRYPKNTDFEKKISKNYNLDKVKEDAEFVFNTSSMMLIFFGNQ